MGVGRSGPAVHRRFGPALPFRKGRQKPVDPNFLRKLPSQIADHPKPQSTVPLRSPASRTPGGDPRGETNTWRLSSLPRDDA